MHELDLSCVAKEREMEMLEDNHRVELRVYQQKVKHLEYEHRNNIKAIVQDGTGSLDQEQELHVGRDRELLRVKEQLKFAKMELELVNASKVAEIRQQQEKQLVKLRQQFDDGLSELKSRCDSRLRQMNMDLELRRRVDVHEVEERKNQHINDLVKNHKKAFGQMKAYYNDITGGNLRLIKNLQKQVVELKDRGITNKKMMLEYVQENQKLSEPLAKVTAEIAEVQTLLRERSKDQMALRNARARLKAFNKNSVMLKTKLAQLEEDYVKVQRERDDLYNTFEDSIRRVQQQSDFYNQALEQKLRSVESSADKAAVQVEEIIRAANLDSADMARVMGSLNQMLLAKDDAIRDSKFLVAKLQKTFNDSFETFSAKLRDLGIPADEVDSLGFTLERLPLGGTVAPAGLIVK